MKTIYYTFFVLFLLTNNTTKAQNFSTTAIANPFGISYNPADGVLQPTFIDIDNDGDQDLFIGRSNSANRKLDFYENIGTVNIPNFANPITLISASISNPPYNNWVFLPTFGDIDGDGDYDLLVGRGDYSTNNFEYYENIGTLNAPTFTTPTFQQIGNGHDPIYADFDSDGDLDLFIGEKPDYTSSIQVQYHENIGTTTSANMNFTGTINNVAGNGAAYISVGDLNLDGYLDLILAENSADILLFTSDNSGNFTTNSVLLTGIEANQKPALVDIDDDGDLDLFIGSETGLNYYENTQITASTNNINISSKISVFPNPTSENLHFNIENIKSYKIFDVFGRLIQSNITINNKTINISTIKEGVYSIVLIGENDSNYTSKFIIN